MHVGLDYHSDSIQVCVLDDGGVQILNRSVENDVQAIIEVIRPLGAPTTVAIESCSGAVELAHQVNEIAGWTVRMAHPGFVRRMKMNPDKTDYADARILADLSRVGYIPGVWLPSRETRELRTIVRRRQHAVGQQKAAKQRIRGLLRDRRIVAPKWAGNAWTKPWMTWLENTETLSCVDRWNIEGMLEDLQYAAGRIKKIETYLERLTANDDIVAFLRSQPNIGPVTAWVIRAEIVTATRFRTGKQMSRFCGLTPRNNSSGSHVSDSGLIRAGNSMLKSVVIQAAKRLCRYEPEWCNLANRLEKREKHKNVITAAIANRWIRRLYHRMMKFETERREQKMPVNAA